MVDLIQVAVIGHGLDADLGGDDLVVIGHDHHSPELRQGQVTGPAFGTGGVRSRPSVAMVAGVKGCRHLAAWSG